MNFGKFKGTDKVRDIMSTDLDTIMPSSKVADAARRMRDSNVGSLPVVDQQKLVGILTDRDVAIRVAADGVGPHDVLVKEVMSPDLITVEPDQTLDEATQLMSKHQVRRLPVVENGRLVGMLALGDVSLDQSAQAKAGEALTDISKSKPSENI